jgi:hypothetical protein
MHAWRSGLSQEFSQSNPNGVAAQSPRLLYSATLGTAVVIFATPLGLGIDVQSSSTYDKIAHHRTVVISGKALIVVMML